MNDNEFSKVGLYKHNVESYRKVREAYESGEKVVGIVHATGTGKTYNALQLSYDNKDKKIIYVVPNNSIAEHIENVIRDNPNLDRDVDFKNLEFRTYQSFINMSREELADLDCDLLILDEFHHLGAPVWGSRINAIVDTHPDMLVFGMTAYTVRDRGTAYERDMANPDTNELFSGKIVSRYDLVDAMLDGVLPRDVIYRTSYTNLLGLEEALENKINSMKATKEELEEYRQILETVKKRIADAPGVAEVMRKYVKPNGKYLYFCPMFYQDGVNDIETIKKEAYEWFRQYVSEEDIVFYVTTSDMGDEGKLNRDAFYNDVTLDGDDATGKLRIMFAINQYNEGVHAPNVDGVIMGRGTTSDIVFFEQLGRALAVRGDTYEKYQEYEKYTYNDLVVIARDKDILVDDNMTKEDIIEKLVAPVIIDLTNNIGFIKNLEDNLKDRVKERRKKSIGTRENAKLREVSFDIDIVNDDLYQVLSSLKDRVQHDWDSMYELAKSYYMKYGDLKVDINFKTLDGVTHDENGYNLGTWIKYQRTLYGQGKLVDDRKKKLEIIDMIFDIREHQWNEMYKLAKAYHEKHDNLDIGQNYRTKNGHEENKDGVKLGVWINYQKAAFRNGKLSNDRKELLEKIGMIFDPELDWNEMYKLAKVYYFNNKCLSMAISFRTKNGTDYDKYGRSLGAWVNSQRKAFRKGMLSNEKIKLLEELKLDFNVNKQDISSEDRDTEWNVMYGLVKVYCQHHNNLNIPEDFKTKNGYRYNSNGVPLGKWFKEEKEKILRGELDDEKLGKWEEIGFSIIAFMGTFNEMISLADRYFTTYRHLNVPLSFRTKDGVVYDEKGYFLGAWLAIQFNVYDQERLSDDKKGELEKVGVIFDDGDEAWNKMYKIAKNYYDKHGNLNINHFYRTDNFENLGIWLYHQKYLIGQNKLDDNRLNKLKELGVVGIRSGLDDSAWDMMYMMAKNYYDTNGNLSLITRYTTFDGINEANDGYNLGAWVETQWKLLEDGKLSKDRVDKLKELGLVVNDISLVVRDLYNSWDLMYDIASIYYQKHGDLIVSNDFKTLNGYEYNELGFYLGTWLNEQIDCYNNGILSDEKVSKLSQIGMIFKKDVLDWEINYKLVLTYYKHNGNVNISDDFRTLNGYDYNKIGRPIGAWLRKQIQTIRTLDEDKLKKLECLGITISKLERNYSDMMYERAKVFYEEHGHLNLRYRYLQDRNCHMLSYDELTLEIWKQDCRKAQKEGKLSKEEYDKLASVGVFLTSHEADWNNMYNLACRYHKHYGHLDVPDGFRTFNGYSYEEYGFELGSWLKKQALKYRNKKNPLSEDRVKKLDALGMNWKLRNTTKNELYWLCLTLRIPFEKNVNIITRTPYMIIIAKARFLSDKGIAYAVDGKLHEIFSMSDKDLRWKYGISIEDIVNKYYIIEEKGRNK